MSAHSEHHRRLERMYLTKASINDYFKPAIAVGDGTAEIRIEVDPKFFEKLKHKLAPGDVLGRIGKIRPRDMDHLGLLLERISPGEPVSMALLRTKDNLATRMDLNVTWPKDTNSSP